MIERFEKAEITPTGLSVKVHIYDTFTDSNGQTHKIQVGPDGKPSPLGHRRAIGIGEFAIDPTAPTAQEKRDYEDRVKAQMSPLLGEFNTMQLATISRLREARNATRVALNVANQQIIALNQQIQALS